MGGRTGGRDQAERPADDEVDWMNQISPLLSGEKRGRGLGGRSCRAKRNYAASKQSGGLGEEMPNNNPKKVWGGYRTGQWPTGAKRDRVKDGSQEEWGRKEGPENMSSLCSKPFGNCGKAHISPKNPQAMPSTTLWGGERKGRGSDMVFLRGGSIIG